MSSTTGSPKSSRQPTSGQSPYRKRIPVKRSVSPYAVVLDSAAKLHGEDSMLGPATFVRLTAAEARARLDTAVDWYVDHGEPVAAEEDDSYYDAPETCPVTGWALLRARLDGLPDDLLDDGVLATRLIPCEPVVEAFLACEHAAALPDRSLARIWAQFATKRAVGSGRAPDAYSPTSLPYLLRVEVSKHLVIDSVDIEGLPAVLAAWAHFTADSRARGPETHRIWALVLPEIFEDFADAYDAPDAVEHRATCPEVIALRSYETGLAS